MSRHTAPQAGSTTPPLRDSNGRFVSARREEEIANSAKRALDPPTIALFMAAVSGAITTLMAELIVWSLTR